MKQRVSTNVLAIGERQLLLFQVFLEDLRRSLGRMKRGCNRILSLAVRVAGWGYRWRYLTYDCADQGSPDSEVS